MHSATNFVDLANAGFGYDIPSFEFAETSINLDALGINMSCPGLSNGHIRTRSGGDLYSSQLKDNIQPSHRPQQLRQAAHREARRLQ